MLKKDYIKSTVKLHLVTLVSYLYDKPFNYWVMQVTKECFFFPHSFSLSIVVFIF